jgi:hypothetical protein
MSAVWHGVPHDMVGDTIYPLMQLRDVAPAAYESQRQKYTGRETVLDFRVPILDVGFNDTVHCSSMHPHRLWQAREELGFEMEARPAPPRLSGLFFEIPLQRIVVHPVLWYSNETLWINGAPHDCVPLVPPQDEFEVFDPDRYQPLPDVPPLHRRYLQQRKARGERGLMFVHIPHVLVAGPIDVSGCRVIGWDEPI